MAMMEKTAISVSTLFLLLPVIFAANSHREFQEDGTITCQEKDAVCKMSSGAYGCCPAADGVCCADGDHCCPSSFKCDLSAKQCIQYEDSAMVSEDMLDVEPIGTKAKGLQPIDIIPAIRIEQAKHRLSGNASMDVTCPAGQTCPDDNTCCIILDGNYGCCSTAFGNCCSNYMTCCPSGYVCNNSADNCIRPPQAA